jgi:site-specific recombinase XerC
MCVPPWSASVCCPSLRIAVSGPQSSHASRWRRLRRALSVDDQWALLRAAEDAKPRDRAIVVLLLYSALCLTELVTLDVADARLSARKVVFPRFRGHLTWVVVGRLGEDGVRDAEAVSEGVQAGSDRFGP